MDFSPEQVEADARRKIGAKIQLAAMYLRDRIRVNVSVPGTKVAATDFVGRGATRTITDAESTQIVMGNMFGVKGKKYRAGRRIYGATRSKPGEFPRKQFGTFRASVSASYDPVTMVGRVGSPSKVGKFLELGTRKMRPRPWLRRTLAMERENIKRIIGAA